MASKSFSKAQRAVLDSGFLDTIGNEKGAGLGLDNTAQALLDLTSRLLLDATKNLEGNISSGKLSSTAEQTVKASAGGLQIQIKMEDYWKFVDQGVNGLNVSQGSPFSFKTKNPSRAMVQEIEGWLKRAGASSENINRSISKKESVGLKFAGSSKAFAVARSIKSRGLKPTLFFTNALEQFNREVASNALVNAARIDVTTSIQNFNQ